jgi:hypothetical protein
VDAGECVLCFRSPDTDFYSAPRFVTHIDDYAINALTKYYASVFPASNSPGVVILDMCSSWISHYPKGYKQEKIVGMGLNADELKRNPVLTEYVVQDLNTNPVLPFQDNTFDVITNVGDEPSSEAWRFGCYEFFQPLFLHKSYFNMDIYWRH